MKSSNLFKLSLLSTAIALTGCGGSSDNNDDTQKANVQPTITVTSTTANENTAVTVTATANDSDGSIASYNWKLTSGQTLDISGSTSEKITFTAPSVSDDSEAFTFDVTATDNEGATATTTSTITVQNVVPTATIEEQTVNEKSNVSVTAEVDGNGDEITSFLWTQTSGTAVELTNTDSNTLTFMAPETSSDETIGLSLMITDIDNDITTVESMVNVSQLTIPLTIAGLATDSPITNGEISVKVAGRDVTVDVTADENGNYSVDLILDDSEADAFISIMAHGVAEQANAGLITLLGTAGQLSTKAGEDNILTEDENFTVNVTNITTAQYALAKLANNGEMPTTDSELESLKQSLNYDEVLTLATAIKVAIDKATENPDLALPEGVMNTLELVDNVEATQAYVQEVIDEPEFEEAQEEIFEDENLVDKSSNWNVPEKYFLLPRSSLHSGSIMRFNNDNTGSAGEIEFTWQEENGVITTVNDDPGFFWIEWVEINGEQVEVERHRTTPSYVIKRLNSSDSSDVLLITRNDLIVSSDGQFPDENESTTTTDNALKMVEPLDISIDGSGVAYLPFDDDQPEDSSITYLGADEFVLNADGSGHATNLDMDFNWKIEDGLFSLELPSEEGVTYLPTWKKITSTLFAHEFYENGDVYAGDDHIASGAILSSRINWQSSDIEGIYTYDNAVFNSPFEEFWIELHANGDAETISSGDYNNDGQLTADEVYIQYGSWVINSDGTLDIMRVRHEDGYLTEDCRKASDPGCVLHHIRSWRVLDIQGSKFTLFHKHDFKSNGYVSYDNRTIFKVANPPLDISELPPSTKILKSQHNSKVSDKFLALEPEL